MHCQRVPKFRCIRAELRPWIFSVAASAVVTACPARSIAIEPVEFGKSTLRQTDGLDNPTSLAFGADGRLYVAQQNGILRAYEVVRSAPNEYEVSATQTMGIIRTIPNHDDDGTLAVSETRRQVTGILATGTAAHPVLYVSSSDPRIGGGPAGNDTNLDTNSGVISRLTWSGSGWNKIDLVRGLPRSEENHASNGMFLDETAGILYLAQGGNTNMGAPSNNLVRLAEYALSGAILAIDLNAIGDSTYDLPTLDDEDRPSAIDAGDPFGGNDGKNQAVIVPGGPVQVYAPGFRNPYDVIVMQSGHMYTIDNGPNVAWGDVPVGEGTATCSNAVNEPGLQQKDNLHHITGPGYYGGHPNPTRAWRGNTFNASNPQSPVPSDNPVECDYRAPGSEDGALAIFHKSTNGLTEYTTAHFDGQLLGNLLAASFDKRIWRIVLSADGSQATTVEPLFETVGMAPLDVVAARPQDPFPGTIWVVDYAGDSIIVFEPASEPDCNVAADCDDGNVCTSDACVIGACEYAYHASPCDDGLECTVDDTCDAGGCSGDDACTPGQTCSAVSGQCEGIVASLVDMTLADFHLSGTQVGDISPDVLQTSDACTGCHGPYDIDNDPYSTWRGSLMGLAGRDPLFYAQMTTANQDVANVGYFCMRCHVPMSFVTGHAYDFDGSTLDDTDRDGVTCHFCHAMVDPIYKPGISPIEDLVVLAAHDEVPSYYGNSMFVLDPSGLRRGPYDDAQPLHAWVASPFHRSGDMCGTCHDVGNVAVTKQPDGTYRYNALDQPSPTEDLHQMFPLERTYSEWTLSAFANGGVDMGGRFGGAGSPVIETCQDCHMPKANAAGCVFTDDRPDLARHEFAGAAAPVLDLIAEYYKDDPAVDLASIARNRQAAVLMLAKAASLELGRDGNDLTVRVINETGHKLPTGHIEGRRIWVNVRFLDGSGGLVDEYGHYDAAEAELDEPSTVIFEMHVGLSADAAAATGFPPGPTGHMALADTIEKDNRIPPRGFDNAAYAAAGAPVVGEVYEDGQYWHDSRYEIPFGASRALVALYYQNTPRHYIEMLRDNNVSDHWGDTLFDLWEKTGKGAPIEMQSAAMDLVPRCETSADCDDADACNGTEVCDDVDGCLPGTPLTCDDGNACNGLETCGPTAGCEPGDPPGCDDGEACNGIETCDPASGCQQGTPIDCDDGDACTTDSCVDGICEYERTCPTTTTTTLAGVTTTISIATTTTTTTTTIAAGPSCSRPVSSGPKPVATDCLYILRAAVGSATCSPECICAPTGTLPAKATDALLCLQVSVGVDLAIDCPCGAADSASKAGTTTTLDVATTTTLSSPWRLLDVRPGGDR